MAILMTLERISGMLATPDAEGERLWMAWK
jgi:hypothetical protein